MAETSYEWLKAHRPGVYFLKLSLFKFIHKCKLVMEYEYHRRFNYFSFEPKRRYDNFKGLI